MVNWITLEGLTQYTKGLDLMRDHLDDMIKKNLTEETILLLEHEEVYSAGSSYKEDEILDIGTVPLVFTRRGGKVTYHGPGQRVIYPIINLNHKKDIRLYISHLQQWIINTLKHIGIEAFIIEGLIGIWVRDRLSGQPAKIAAIGVRVKKWIAYHGIAINLNTDLKKFSNIIPCGITRYQVTSIENMGIKISMRELDKILKAEFYRVFYKD